MITIQFRNEKLRFIKARYVYFNNLCIEIESFDDGIQAWVPYGSLTVNLDKALRATEAYLDTNNCGPDLINIMLEKGYCHKTGETGVSGFCTYPVVQFTDEFLGNILEL